MNAICSYHGNRPTHTHKHANTHTQTNPQTGPTTIHCAQCNDTDYELKCPEKIPHLRNNDHFITCKLIKPHQMVLRQKLNGLPQQWSCSVDFLPDAWLVVLFLQHLWVRQQTYSVEELKAGCDDYQKLPKTTKNETKLPKTNPNPIPTLTLHPEPLTWIL